MCVGPSGGGSIQRTRGLCSEHCAQAQPIFNRGSAPLPRGGQRPEAAADGEARPHVRKITRHDWRKTAARSDG